MRPCRRCPEWAEAYAALEKQYEMLQREHAELKKERNVLKNRLDNASPNAVRGTMDW